MTSREDMYARITFRGQWIIIHQHGWEGSEYCYYLPRLLSR